MKAKRQRRPFFISVLLVGRQRTRKIEVDRQENPAPGTAKPKQARGRPVY